MRRRSWNANWGNLDFETVTMPTFEIDLWFVPLAKGSIDLKWATAQLSAVEISRANRFRFEHDRDHYTASHAVLRRVLADRLNVSSAAVQFETGPTGKPRLAACHDASLEFNLSHSGDQALIGLTTGGPIGVDVEAMTRSVDQAEIVNRFFSTQERSEWNSLPLTDRPRAFFRAWTRKEAYVKARGDGLGHDSDRYTVNFHSKFPTPLVSDDLDPTAVNNYQIIPITAPAGYCAACVAKTAQDQKIVCNFH